MKSRTPVLVTAAVLVGLGLGASVLRGQVPVSEAQPVSSPSPAQSAPARPAALNPTALNPTALNEGAARLQNEANTVDIVKKYEPGLVYISTEQTVQQDPFGMMGGGQQQVEGVGSGFFVNAAGDILTNFHVVRGADRIQIRLMGNKQTYSATVVGRRPRAPSAACTRGAREVRVGPAAGPVAVRGRLRHRRAIPPGRPGRSRPAENGYRHVDS